MRAKLHRFAIITLEKLKEEKKNKQLKVSGAYQPDSLIHK